MQINLAQALKEKNRIVGEISVMWGWVNKDNSALTTHKRTVDVEETMKTIDHYTAKLIELKTKIGKANDGNLKNIYALEEAKSKLAKLNNLNTNEDAEYNYRNGCEIVTERTAIYDAVQVMKMVRKLQMECNHLQDKIDAYNATNTIEFESPLR